MSNRLRIGSRGSNLAILQAESVRDMLANINPGIEFEMVVVSTTGDQNQTVSLEQLGGEGVFVKELEEALVRNEIDIAVHSLKDMLTTIPEELKLAAVPKRIDPRDVVVSPIGKLNELPRGARIGTGSQRRAVQIKAMRPDLEICDLRGNIDTRIRKAHSDDYDGIIMAAAALVRLGMEDKIAEYLPTENFVPAVGQGALGIEIRVNDSDTLKLVAQVNHEQTWHCVTAERSFLNALGGGCRAPIAAYGIIENDRLTLNGIVASHDGSEIIRAKSEGNAANPQEIGRNLASKMVEMGADSITQRYERF